MVLGIVGNNTTYDAAPVSPSQNALYGVTVSVDTLITHMEMLFPPAGGSGVYRCGVMAAIPLPTVIWDTQWLAFVDINGVPGAARIRRPLNKQVTVRAGQTVYLVVVKISGTDNAYVETTAAVPINASAITPLYFCANMNVGPFVLAAGFWGLWAGYADGTEPPSPPAPDPNTLASENALLKEIYDAPTGEVPDTQFGKGYLRGEREHDGTWAT